MTYYKVVMRVGNDTDFVSAVATGKACVHYTVGEWIDAPKYLAKHGYCLCVFDDRRSAIGFAIVNGLYGRAVFECECEDEVELPKHQLDLPMLHYYGGQGGLERFYLYVPWPVGTRMFKRVNLLNELWVLEW